MELKLDTSTWKEFKISDLFPVIKAGKVSSTADLEVGTDVYYMGAKKNDNCAMYLCKYDPELISEGNCIAFICDGQGSIGYNNYIEKDFIGTVNLMLGYNPNLNPNIGLFLVTILDLERPKFSFGRKRKPTLLNTTIKLPTVNNTTPDWQYMNDYIEALINQEEINKQTITESIKTNNKHKESIINTINWKTYKLTELFEIETGTDLIYREQEQGNCWVVGHKAENHGITCNISELCDRKKYDHTKTISLGDRGTFIAYTQPYDFYIGTRVKALISKSKKANVYNLMFISTIINSEQFKFNYGRNATDKIPNIEIKLPSDNNGNPDWQYMENYIKSLPYGDKI